MMQHLFIKNMLDEVNIGEDVGFLRSIINLVRYCFFRRDIICFVRCYYSQKEKHSSNKHFRKTGIKSITDVEEQVVIISGTTHMSYKKFIKKAIPGIKSSDYGNLVAYDVINVKKGKPIRHKSREEIKDVSISLPYHDRHRANKR